MGYYSTTIQKGSTGNDVTEWQKFLNTQGYNIDVDGIFGDKTYNATIEFQRKKGIGTDGIVGEKTWGAAGYNLSASANDFSYDDFKYGDYEKSKDVQKAADAYYNYIDNNNPGKYQSQWQDNLNALMDKILNRKDFSYDLNGDALYQQYKDQYMTQGKLAMQDTIGQASAMTGGYGNSYAATVGNQAYQSYLGKLNEIVPELYQLALNRYNQEGEELYNQYGMLSDRENLDYGRYRDTLSDYLTERDYLANRYYTERDYDYSKYINERDFAYDIYSTDKNLAYQEYRNAIEDEQWQRSFEETQRQNEIAYYQWEREFEENKKQSNKTTSNNSTNTTNKTNTTTNNNKNDTTKVEPPKETASDYAGWDGSDWENYFAQIRQSEGKEAAQTELQRMIKAGLIKNVVYITMATRGVAGGLPGH